MMLLHFRSSQNQVIGCYKKYQVHIHQSLANNLFYAHSHSVNQALAIIEIRGIVLLVYLSLAKHLIKKVGLAHAMRHTIAMKLILCYVCV